MSPTDIKLVECSIINITFNHNPKPKGQGVVRVDYGPLSFKYGAGFGGDSSRHGVVVSAEPVVTGVRDDKADENEFLLKIEMRMIYTYDKIPTDHVEVISNNTWYFTSLLRAYFKFYAESIMSKSSFQGVDLPYN
ncbi:hypothetical protein ACVMY6_004628 [Klebsiella pneumoniae]